MGLIRDLATYGISRGVSAARGKGKSTDDSDSFGSTPSYDVPKRGGSSTGGSSSGSSTDTKKRSTAQDLAGIAKKRAEEGGKRPGVDTSQYSVGSMGLAGPVSDASPDFMNGRRKRSNGKRE